MNTEVTAQKMNVRAVAEKGILINEVKDAADTNWDDAATANQKNSSASLLYPTSTADGSNWYHAASKKSNSNAGATAGTKSGDLTSTGYETLTGLTSITSMTSTATAGTTAARETMGKAADAEAGYYVHYTYYLKSASEEITLGTASGNQNVKIKEVVATAGGSDSADLNKSLRVGVKLNSEFYIYAPITGYTASYYVNASSEATAPKAGNVKTLTDLETLPAVTADGTEVHVYIWYEGEDANCKTDNARAATLDNIDVSIVFGLDTVE